MKTDGYYIRFYVKSLENPMFKDVTAWHIFQFCLLQAYPNGSFTIGRNQLEKWSGIKGTTAYKCLLRLKNAKMVTIEVTGGSNNRFSLVSIVNWEKYQSLVTTPSNNLGNNPVTINEQSSNNPVTHYNKEIRIKNKEELDTNVSSIKAKSIYAIFAETWKLVFGKNPPSDKIKTQYPVKRLSDNYGIEKVCGVLLWLEKNRAGLRFAPNINCPLDLEQKWNGIINLYKKENQPIEELKWVI